MPLMRALWLHYASDAEAAKLADEYLWGRDMLVAPVVKKGAQSRRIYLPAGEWFDWWTGEKFSGAKWIERKVDLATMPIYVRAGCDHSARSDPAIHRAAVSEPTTINILSRRRRYLHALRRTTATLSRTKRPRLSLDQVSMG
jgi:alpha-glucosidase (family GH31 glycosyl hydrolase)